MPLLDAEPLLVDRLKAACPAVSGNVFAAADLAAVQEAGQVTPALHVVLHHYRKLDDDAGSGTLWRETWLVVACVKNVRQHVGAAAIRNAAGALLAEVMAALDGWRCPGAVGLVRAIDPPAPLVTDGFGYFPLAFAVNTVTTGAEDL